ncbi:MAG: hypothetical protein ABH849_02870 [Nanoarchaeota archaeon]
MKKIIFIIPLVLVLCLSIAMAYETYDVSDEDFEAGYTEDLYYGDKFTVSIDGNEYDITVLSVYVDTISLSVSENNKQRLGVDSEIWSDNMNFEVTFDDYYDIYVKLNSIDSSDPDPRLKTASVTVRKTNEEVPEGTDLPYSCYEVYVCPDGSEVAYCERETSYDDEGNVVGGGCKCKTNPSELCEAPAPSSGSSSGGGGGGIDDTTDSEDESEDSSGESAEVPDDVSPSCNGCFLEDTCVQFGYRTEDNYCNVDGEFMDQKEAGVSCNNNFECSTNLCIDNECISQGIWQRFLNFMKRFFG